MFDLFYMIKLIRTKNRSQSSVIKKSGPSYSQFSYSAVEVGITITGGHVRLPSLGFGYK